MAGHIAKRVNADGSVTWRVIVPTGYGRGAPRVIRAVRRPRDTKNPPQAAVDLLAELRAQAEGGVIVDRNVTMNDLLDRWMDEWVEDDERYEAASQAAYRSTVDLYLKPSIGHIRAASLQPRHVAEMWRNLRALPRELSSVRRYYAGLHLALNWGIEQGLVSKNVCDSKTAKLPIGRHEERPVLSLTQMLAMLEKVRGTDMAMPVLIAISAGTRRGEAIGVMVREVDVITRNDVLAAFPSKV